MESSKPKSKAKTASKSKKPAATSKAGKTQKAAVKSHPGENEIRLKAQEIYNERIFRGEHGTPEQDWLKAEEQLSN
jgi:hypothetical protein